MQLYMAVPTLAWYPALAFTKYLQLWANATQYRALAEMIGAMESEVASNAALYKAKAWRSSAHIGVAECRDRNLQIFYLSISIRI